MAKDDFFAEPKTQTIADRSFRGEEGFKEPFDGFFGDAGTRIRYGKDDAAFTGDPMGSFACADEEVSRGGTHRVERISDKVGKDLTDLTIETPNRTSRPQTSGELCPRVVQTAQIDIQNFVDQTSGIDVLRAAGLAVEAERL